MISTNTKVTSIGLKLHLIVSTVSLCLVSTNVTAGSIQLSYGQLEQEVSLPNQTVSLSPIGASVSTSLDLSEDWKANLSYRQWDDDTSILNQTNVGVDLTTWGGSLTYYMDEWSFSGSYNGSQDDMSIMHKGHASLLQESKDTSSNAFGAAVGYGWAKGNWFYNLSLAIQYSDWDIDTVQIASQRPPRSNEPPSTGVQEQHTSGNSSSASASWSIAHFWPLTQDTGVLVGGLLSWNYLLSGESVLEANSGRVINSQPSRPSRTTTNIGRTGGSVSSFTGDDNYGQFSLYMSYDLNASWSFDVDVAVDIGTDTNDRTWSIGLGYLF